MLSLPLRFLCSSLSLAVFSPPVVIENGQLSALREALHEKQEEEQCIAL